MTGDTAAILDRARALAAQRRTGTPEEAVALSNAAEGLRRQGRLDEAEDAHRLALAWLPGFGGIHFNLGVLLQAKGRIAEAAEAYAEAARLMDRFAPAFSNLGAMLKDLGRHDEAAAALARALVLAPDLLPAWLNLGAVRKEQGQEAEAAALFRIALALRPDLAEGWANLALSLKDGGKPAASLAGFERALRLGLADGGGVLAQLVQQMRHLCRWDGLAERSAALSAAVRAGTTRQVHPWIFLGEDAGPEDELRCAERYTAWKTRGLPARGDGPGFRFDRGPRDRLRIGYLSADFHQHATAVLLAEVIERHDRARFEVVGCSYGADDGGALRARLKRGFDHFLDLAGLPHAEAARRIHAAGIDILVDLKGHTQNARPEIAALRPAPVQAQWLGYPGTMGAPFIDYVIADSAVAPFAEQPFYAERIVHLPHCYQPNDRTRPVADPPPRAACGLPDDGFVFCCFNSPYKITPAVFALWMRLLTAVPGSVLWLLETLPEAAANLRREAAVRGVDPARLIFSPRLPLAEYLGRYRLADLFLDTAPVCAHTTASDALWAGLPVLTMTGRSFAGRVAASLLHALGLPELVTESPAAYESAALRLARDPGALAELRRHLAEVRLTAPPFDTPRFTRALENAFAAMWAIHDAGEAPRGFAVAED